jgi:uncharacterized membrane protein YgcG
LLSTVDGLSDVTIFAPLNTAFEAIGNLALNLSTTQLANILQYHVVNGTVGYSSDLSEGKITALNGGDLDIRMADNSIFVNQARVVNPNILIAGGVMHVIDSVLNPNDTSAKPMVYATTAAVAFSGASTATSLPFTSGITATTTVSALVATTETVVAGSTGGSGGSGGSGNGNGNGNGGSSSSGLGAMPTVAMNAAALLGGAAMAMNW